ncbi:conserved Plasmodium protein, unknown function [Plasmodium chabaudi chabaudi]|uniref:Uncharacterized protein n=1 Tax=Plasmodium chabaudi chabaudi TaxID=31271 RepID=A0A4V0K6J8_PLACU|nr:conserved Plasmodium protein, unknown function [Plasmodium chabaudi chabaudi]VTZ68125.1 conserved Plasmodium protein, unknown function [Plasmodium chabaudi chabaudi]|eukprot:XP_016653661.1 conserved Plasmodium protein, unknown function [Plasmodium chabaudi chabaudi]
MYNCIFTISKKNGIQLHFANTIEIRDAPNVHDSIKNAQLKIAHLMNRNKNESDLKKNVDFNVAVGAGKGVTTKRFSAENSAISEILNSKLFQRNSCPNISIPINNKSIDKEPILGKSPKPFAPEKISNLNKLLDENYKKKLIATLQMRNNKYDDTEKIECDSKETNGNINTQNINNSFCKERTNIPLNKSKCSDHTHISSDNEENNICINKIQDNESYKNQTLVENETNDLSYFKNNNTLTDDSTCTPDEENSNNELPQKKSTHFFLYFFNLKKKKNRNFNEDKQKTQKMSNYPNGLIPPKKNRRSLKYLFFY